MGDIPVVKPNETIFVLPSKLVESPEFQVRPWAGGDNGTEQAAIENLAKTMLEEGQTSDIIVIPNHEPDRYVIVAGHRRKKAAQLINDKRVTMGQPLFKLRAQVMRGVDGYLLRRIAIIDNLHRKNYSAMDRAMLIADVKKRNKWDGLGFKGSQKVAEYLKMDLATVTQHEKFVTAPREIQEKLGSGELTAQGAFMLLDVKPEKRAEVSKKAEEIQAASQPKPKESKESKEPSAPKPADPKPVKVQAPAIRKAIRATEGATDKPTPRSRKEILEIIEECDAPAYGYPDAPVRVWARYMVDKYAAGEGTDRTWFGKFDAMTEKAGRGSKDSEPKPEDTKKVKVSKVTATGKAVRKDSKKGKVKTA